MIDNIKQLQYRIQERKKVILFRRMKKKAMEDADNKNDSIAVQVFKEFNEMIGYMTELDFARIVLKNNELKEFPSWESLEEAVSVELKELYLTENKHFFTFRNSYEELTPNELVAFMFICKHLFIHGEIIITAEDISDGTILSYQEAEEAFQSLKDKETYISKMKNTDSVFLVNTAASESVNGNYNFVMWMTNGAIETLQDKLAMMLLFYLATEMDINNYININIDNIMKKFLYDKKEIKNKIEYLKEQCIMLPTSSSGSQYMLNPNIVCKRIGTNTLLKKKFWILSDGDMMLEMIDGMKGENNDN